MLTRGRFLILLLFAYSGNALGDGGARVSVLSTEIDGDTAGELASWRPEFDRRVSKAVARAQMTVAPTSAAACFDTACLATVAQSHSANLVIAARVVVDTERQPGYRISVVVFNAATNERREEAEDCPRCFESKAADLLYTVATKALAAPQGPNLITPSPLPVPVESSNRTAFLVVGSVSAALFVGGAVGFGVEAARNGSCSHKIPDGRCSETVDSVNGMITSGVLALVGAVGAAVFFPLAVRHEPKKISAWITPTAGTNSAGILVGGVF